MLTSLFVSGNLLLETKLKQFEDKKGVHLFTEEDPVFTDGSFWINSKGCPVRWNNG